MRTTKSILFQTCNENEDDDDDGVGLLFSRREALVSSLTAAAALATSLPATAAHADDNVGDVATISIGAKWKAVDGLNSLDKQFVSFDSQAYQAMAKDPTRTPFFKQAIEQRLLASPELTLTVLDLGTGPSALFAIMAAQAGAAKVYAIEADPEICLSARQTVKKSGFDDIITVVEGFSTNITLPEKVDLCIAEIVGSIASEEGAYATIRDAHQRLVKNPNDPASWIPNRIQTYAAPASYTLHNLFGPPEFDWTKLGGEPIRFSCRDRGLELLADPVVVEDISFADIMGIAATSTSPKSPSLAEKNTYEVTFTVDKARISSNEGFLFDEFRRGKSSVADSQRLAKETAQSLSGIAMWPRLYLTNDIIVNSRQYGSGGHQSSHWQTVLPIMAVRPIGGLQGGETIQVKFDFDLPVENVDKSPAYSIQGTIQYSKNSNG
eukprot:CAMPEP_0198136742 /NCGR_PEP_ID=MMETSP1443-20131203/358_1 /TAXON_ID=186043 /ORGANISM="Entomoneis sp., Strain CCMP2396" /LENGTH=436 /DNA_ID=CAMNT_0043798013 /DNA_START=163 /DNA_END=1473 /DNA_ORIENTATION=+